MFKKLKEKRVNRLKGNIAEYEQYVANNEALLEDIKNNYLPLRDKCEKVIRDNKLNYYSLGDCFHAAYKDDKLTLRVCKVDADVWDGKAIQRLGDVVFEETVQLRCFNPESFVADQILKLKDPTWIIERDIERDKSMLNLYKRDLENAN